MMARRSLSVGRWYLRFRLCLEMLSELSVKRHTGIAALNRP